MHKEEKKILEIAIEKMDIPDQRRNVHNRENIIWMKDNLGIKNSEHRHFEQAMKIISTILEDEKQ